MKTPSIDPVLITLAQDALTRLEESPLPPARPQLLACAGGMGLLRVPDGLGALPFADFPRNLDLSPLIDHTLLRADARGEEVDRLCDEALEHGFASVCVNPLWVARAARRLQGSAVRTCTVVGFPLGASTLAAKAGETLDARGNGATEIDMVLALGHAKAGAWELVRQDIRSVKRAAGDAKVKMILETCLLTEGEKILASRLALEEGLDFVKTSTGFSKGGATLGDVALMRATVGPRLGVKASGGVRDYATALAMVKAGATRLGVSASLAIVA